MKRAKKELKIEFLELNWEDIISYVIKDDDLVQCARFIHQARTSGGSVLVHCIQVYMYSQVSLIFLPMTKMIHKLQTCIITCTATIRVSTVNGPALLLFSLVGKISFNYSHHCLSYGLGQRK